MNIQNLIFIDAAVVDFQTIIDDLPPGSEWFLLDATQDGIAQIATIAANYSDLASIQIVSHGTPGSLQLGNTSLSNANSQTYAGLLTQIGHSLSSNGDLLLYGCNVAQGSEGQAFIANLSNLTNADVAASIDRTGSAALGGNGILEARTGVIESVALDFAAYSAVLAPNTAPTFFTGTGQLKTDIGATPDAARDVVVLPDGKFIVVGTNGAVIALARYNADGSLDTTYSGDGKVIGANGSGAITGAVLQPNGQVVVAVDSGSDFAVYRFDAFGNQNISVTTDFAGVDDASDIALQADGKFVVAGTSSGDFAVARYNTNGTLDTTFDIDGKQTTDIVVTDEGAAVAVQTDGKILVAGTSNAAATADFAVVRYNTNGSLDTTFSSDGKFTSSFGGEEHATSLTLQADGKIVLGGYTSTGVGGTNDFALVRINTNGTLDTTFDTDGRVTTSFGADDRISSIVIQGDGKIIAAGRFDAGSSNFAVARYNTNGSLDTTFGGDGQISLSFGGIDIPYSVKLQADGKLLVVGDTNASTAKGDRDFAVARLNTNGSVDTTFSGDGRIQTDIGGTADLARDVVIQPDGKIVVSGQSGIGLVITRYNADGSLDTTFNGDGKIFGGLFTSIQGLTLQGDGKIIAGLNGGGTSELAFARYNTDGTLDSTFGTAFGTDFTSPADVTVQGDGKIVVAGTSLNNFAVARFNTNGTLDTTFDTDGEVTTDMNATDQAAAVVMQSNGKILVAGSDFVGANANFAVARYNTNGSVDTTFSGDGQSSDSFGLEDIATSMALQSNGKIVVAGYTNVNSATTGPNDIALLRLNTDGSLDTTFDGDGRVITDLQGSDNRANSVVIQSDGKIVVAGSTGTGSENFLVARYNSNGSLDTTFSGDGLLSLTFGSADFGYDVKLQTDGKIVVVGQSNTGPAGTDNDFAILRLNTDGSLDTTFNLSVNTLADANVYLEQSVTPAVIDSNVVITDAELTATNYSGATLTVARQGGANAQDVFSATGGALSALIEGNTLVLSGVIIGGVVQNSDGLLSLSFNTNATQARVNQTLSSLGYLNTSNNPSASVVLDFTFNDGNAGAQGTGGALFTVGSKTVLISLVNDAPTAYAAAVTYTPPNVTYTFLLSDFGFSDAEDASLTSLRIDTLPASGNLRFDGFNINTTGVEFTAAEIQAGRLTFAPSAAGGGFFDFKVRDSGGLLNTARSVISVSTSGEIWNGTSGNDTHVSTILADTLIGLGGDDTLNGGAGIDTAVYSGASSQYAYINHLGILRIADRVAGRDGVDQLIGMEQAQFNGDGGIQTLSSVNSFIALEYIASHVDLMGAFGANAQAGYDHFVNSGRFEGRQVSFNAAEYIASYTDLIGAFGTNQDAAAAHYINVGRTEGRQVSFNALEYIASYTDLSGAFGLNEDQGALHYINTGRLEGRTVSFSGAQYLANYDDLQGAFGNNIDSAAAHFIQSGRAEGRLSGPIVLTGSSGNDTLTGGSANEILSGLGGDDLLNGGGGAGDSVLYSGAASQYAFIKHLGILRGADRTPGRDGVDQLLNIEQARFSSGGPVTLNGDASFTPLEYIASYTDLIGAFGASAQAGYDHFINAGRFEGRQVSFNALEYIASYGDLIGAFGANEDAGATHYIASGRLEGRTEDFNAAQYLANYADLQAAFGSNQEAATIHYIQSGFFEGRTDNV